MSAKPPVASQHEVDETLVRDRAYKLWEQAGRPDGDHERHWQDAHRQILAEQANQPAIGGKAAKAAPVVPAKDMDDVAGKPAKVTVAKAAAADAPAKKRMIKSA